MASKDVIHYELCTDLSPNQIRKRLKGTWLDRYKSKKAMKQYKEWEKGRR